MREREATAFLERVLPTPGNDVGFFCCSFGSRTVQEAYTDKRALAGRALALSDQGLDAYMAASGFDRSGSRKGEHVQAVRSLWMDLDCGDPKDPYATRKEAMLALEGFRRDLNLPEPLVVNSGYGYHVYWPFDRDIGPDRWKTLAEGFRDAMRAQGLRPGPQRTAEIASVLRVPGTLNFKRPEAPAPVRVLSWGAPPTDPALLEQAFGAAPVPPRSRVRRGLRETFKAFAHEGIGDRFDRDPEALLRGCPQLKAAATPGADRNSWLLMLGVMRFCRGGREKAHELSRGDPGRYDPRELDRQLDSLDGGPPRCERFAEFDPAPCAGCAWRGRISTPVQAEGAAPSVPVPADGKPEPEPFRNQEFEVVPGEGLIWLCRTKGRDGEIETSRVRINENEFYLDEIQSDTEEIRERRYIVFRVRSGDRPFRQVFFSISDDMSGVAFMNWLGNHGLLPVTPGFARQMRDFMGSYLARLQQRLRPVTRRYHFGWSQYYDLRSGRRETGFTVGGTMFTGAGPACVALDERCERMARYEYVRAGSLEAWKAVPGLYRVLDQPEGQLFVCASFAAPFMTFGTGTARNVIMVMWDARGGKGKTSALQAANSVWGHPVELTSAKNDTLSARYQVLAARRNLPYCMDELTAMRDTDLSSLLFDIANGREKRKSKSGGADLVNTGSWSTVTLLTSNRSVYELLRNLSMQTVADSMRVVEIPCRFKSYSGTETGRLIERMLRLMDANYGHAGPAFMDWCMTRRPGAFTDAAAAAAEWDFRVRQSSEERFWTYGLGLVLQAGRLAVEAGLLDYDMNRLDAWVTDVLLPQMRTAVNTQTSAGDDIMSMFLNENLDSTLVVASAVRPKVRAPEGDTGFRLPDREGDGWIMRLPTRQLHVRLELDTRTFYVEARHFERWCVERRCSPAAVIKELADMGKRGAGERKYAYLGRGVGALNRGKLMCYRFSDMEVPDGFLAQDT